MNFSLIMFRQDGQQRDIPLAPGITVIGRKQDCTIRIPLGMVSRHHAQIQLDDSSATLKDLGSANSTFLNNRRVTEEGLEPGDQIMIGPVIFTVQIDGLPGNDEIVKIRSKVSRDYSATGGINVGTSQHVYISDEDIDPISALENLASSAEQTAIHSEDDNELSDD